MSAPRHLDYLKKVRLACGFINPKDLTDKSSLFRSIYRVYTFVAMPMYLINLSLMTIDLFMEFDDPQKTGETLSYSTLYWIMFVSLLYIEAPGVRNVFNSIDREEEEMATANSTIRKIFVKHSKINNKAGSQVTWVCGIFCCILVVHHMGILEGRRGYVFHQWYPFNQNNYYWLIMVDQTFFLSIALSYMMYTKQSVISISTYILARITMLQHFIVHLEHYALYIRDQTGVTLDQARYEVIKHCVNQHNILINYVSLVREHTSTFILLDFGLTSLQLGSILISLTLMENRRVDQLVLSYYFVLNIHWMYITYYNGNEVMVQSVNVGLLVHTKLDWYNYDKKAKDGLAMITMKAQAPLSLSIGPLAELSLTAFLTVIRATFSYMTFMKTIYQ